MDALRAFFDHLADEWDAQQPPDREERLREQLSLFRPLLEKSRRVLEIGTGTGALIPLIQEAVPQAIMVSVDLSHRMLRRARHRSPAASLLRADAHFLPLASQSVDLVICHNVFPHFRDKPAALRELARVLEEEGHLLILHDLGREQVNAIHRRVGGAIGNDLLPPGEDLGRMMAEAGFIPLRITGAEILNGGISPQRRRRRREQREPLRSPRLCGELTCRFEAQLR